MTRLLLIGVAAGAFALASTVSAPAMPVVGATKLIGSAGSDIQVRGGHGHGHHYGWGRGRGHHYGWYRGRHRGWR